MGVAFEGENFFFLSFIAIMVFVVLWVFMALILVLYGFSTLVFKYSMTLIFWFYYTWILCALDNWML